MAADVHVRGSAAQPPEVTIRGRRYVGRLPDAGQWAAIAGCIAGAGETPLTPSQNLALIRVTLRLFFPWRPWMLWRGDPVRRLMQLPYPALLAAWGMQVAHVAAMHGATPPTRPPAQEAANG